jgi:trans-2,3-dihydro-3-hydroxyanthranilate isomerase
MPTSYPFTQVDAFTETPLSGNPCAVVFDADALNDESRLAIAREMNLSATSFVLRSERADFGARYFTPAEEIPLAGHPTIATVFALVDAGRLKLTGDLTTISLELSVGPIRVDIESRQGVVKKIVMSQKKPQFLRTYAPEEVMPVFSLAADDLLPGAPLQTVSTGTPQLMIPVRDPDVLRRSSLNTALYIQLRARSEFLQPHLFCLRATEQGDTFARHFVTPPDLLEDPFRDRPPAAAGAYLALRPYRSTGIHCQSRALATPSPLADCGSRRSA